MKLSNVEKLGLVIGILLRLILMPLTLHPDLWALSFASYFFAFEGVTNIYDYLAHIPQDHPLVSGFGVKDLFIYPPLAFFTLGIFMKLLSPFHNRGLIEQAMGTPGETSLSSGIFSHAFLVKLPYLFIDLGIAFLLRSLFTDAKKKQLVFLLWLFNPVTLYATFMIGQIDVVQTFFIVLGLVLALKNKTRLSMVPLGLAASYKMFPLFLIPIAAFVLAKQLKDRVVLLLIGLGTYVATIAPFLGSPAFRGTIFASDASQKLLFMKLPLTGAEAVYVFIFLYTLVLLLSWYGVFAKRALWLAFLLVFLTFYAVSHYHPQWFLWMTPFLVLLIATRPHYRFLTTLLVVPYVILIFFFESSLSWGLFGPINHALFSAPSLSDLLPAAIDVVMVKSIIRSFYAAVSVYIAIRLLREKAYELS